MCKKLRSSVTRGVGQVGPLPMFQELNSSGFERRRKFQNWTKIEEVRAFLVAGVLGTGFLPFQI